MSTAHTVPVVSVGAGFVCHGQFWPSMSALREHVKTAWPGSRLAVRVGDATTEALWQSALSIGTARLAG